MSGTATRLQLLRLASPGLPIGGYSYSQGMETALDLGLVHDETTARHWLADLLAGPLSQFDGAMLAACCRAAAIGDMAALQRLNAQLLASRDSREQVLESTQMGYSLRQLLLGLPEGGDAALWPAGEPLSLPVAWALAARCLQLPGEQALEAWLWGWLENQVMVLMKAMPMGQSAGQRLISSLLPELATAAARAWQLPPGDISNFAPLYAWVAQKHETQYSRLFRS